MRSVLDRLWRWYNRPRRMSAEEVAALLRKFVAGTATHSEWDYFASGPPLADAELEGIRNDTSELHGPRVEPYTTERLRELLARAEAIASR